MSAPFVTQLRTRGDVIQMATAGATPITIRVELPEVWETVRLAVSRGESVRAVKTRVLETLAPTAAQDAFVMKLRGFEVLDETMSLDDVGAVDGSIFLLTNRRRRPVR